MVVGRRAGSSGIPLRLEAAAKGEMAGENFEGSLESGASPLTMEPFLVGTEAGAGVGVAITVSDCMVAIVLWLCVLPLPVSLSVSVSTLSLWPLSFLS